MPSGKKRKGHKMATHKRKKRLRKNRHKSKKESFWVSHTILRTISSCPGLGYERCAREFVLGVF